MPNTASEIFNKTLCITGALANGTRAVYEAKIKDMGGKIGSVTKTLDYLVTNDTDTTSSKMAKTLEINTHNQNAGIDKRIRIISEDELIKMLGIAETEKTAIMQELFFVKEPPAPKVKILNIEDLKQTDGFEDLIDAFNEDENVTIYMTHSPDDLNHIPGIRDQINLRIIPFLKENGINNLIFGVIDYGDEKMVTSLYASGITSNKLGEAVSRRIFRSHLAARYEEYGPEMFEGQLYHYFERE